MAAIRLQPGLLSVMRGMTRALACAGALAGTLSLAACSFGTGRYYTDEGVASLVPGQSTMMEATRAFNAPPTAQFAQSDGTMLARWDYKFSLVTDAVYGTKSTLLQFGADGRLIRLVDSDNVMLSNDSRRKLLGVYVQPAPPPDLSPIVLPAAPEDPASMPIVIPGNGPVSTPASDGKTATPR